MSRSELHNWECAIEELSGDNADKMLIIAQDIYNTAFARGKNYISLEQYLCEGMRNATEEERKSTKDYIDSISKPTGLQFDDIYEELDFVQPHKKISVNLQLCKDCISREEAINELKLAYFNKDLQSAKDDPCIVDAMTDWAIRTIKNLPSVQPQPKRGYWEDCSNG